MAKEIPISKAIESLRSELQAAMAEGEGKPLRFGVESIELELQAQVTWNGETSATATWWLLGAEAKASRESGTMQTVRLTLTAHGVEADGSTSRAHLSGADED